MSKMINTTKSVIPIIYAYTHPNYPKHDGCTKIGYSEQDGEKRIAQQNETADVDTKLEWTENAVYSGTNETFKDYDFHAYLEKNKVERLIRDGNRRKTEWFRIEPREARIKLMDFRDTHGTVESGEVIPYELRSEQLEAVEQTKAYFETHQNSEFLWNAKPRFGKTLTAYELCIALNLYKILIITQSGTNPYETLPKLNLLTYKMSDIVLDKAKKGFDFDNDGVNESYVFDLNEFFKTKADGTFQYEEDVDKFLDALTTQKKFPFSEEYREELNHTLWILKYVNSAKALARKLETHPIFKEYKIILAAGDGKLDEEGNGDIYNIERESKKSYEKVVKAISENEKTITLSVGQLTTGITIPEWTAVMMLSNINSPALYMQAAFRAQNPCLFHIGTTFKRKENCYVFDFDPARSLEIFEKFANGLKESKNSDTEIREQNVKELLNFLPVYSEDDNGEMIELDAEKVLLIPRQIHSQEVVRCGFMSNYLFQNIGRLFLAPSEIIETINKMESVTKKEEKVNIEKYNNLDINEDGEIEIPNSMTVGKAQEIFGDKVYKEQVEEVIKQTTKNHSTISPSDISKNISDSVINQVLSKYGNVSKSAQNAINKQMKEKVQKEFEKHEEEFSKKMEKLTSDLEIDLETSESEEEKQLYYKLYEEQRIQDEQFFQKELKDSLQQIISDCEQDVVERVETEKQEKEKKSEEDTTRDHLRGFAKTIPSFLMAYGDEDTTLENFDTIIPDEVFKEVTGINLEEFRKLRDGMDYIDKETGEQKHFEGHVFDLVVFNDSVKLFIQKKKELANYFDETATEDIFDYIPNQKTNQIFTPKKVVKKMVDYLEQENSGCFDNPDSTFIDMYMKSGLYITEIVKRLFKSEVLKQLYPDENERLKHIFEKQVFGLAPTPIIYQIAIHYILGFSEDSHLIQKHNLRQEDALKYIQEGTLSEKLDEWFQ